MPVDVCNNRDHKKSLVKHKYNKIILDTLKLGDPSCVWKYTTKLQTARRVNGQQY